jgi:hypothetical protein
LEQATQPQITIPSNTNPAVLTIENMRAIYRQRYAMAKRLGFEAWFVASFGTEEEWMGQFTVMPYDKEENKF